MNDEEDIASPLAVWAAYVGLVGVGLTVGALAGTGVIGGAAFVVFFLGSLAVFMPWAVWQQDARSLEETDAYKKARSDSKSK